MDKSAYENVYAAGGAELVAYTEYREHIKGCSLCSSLRIDDQMTCSLGLFYHRVWEQKQMKSLEATLKATRDFS